MDSKLREYLRGPQGMPGKEGKTGSPGLTVSTPFTAPMGSASKRRGNEDQTANQSAKNDELISIN